MKSPRTPFKLVLLLAAIVSAGCEAKPHDEPESPAFLVTSPLKKDTTIHEEYVAQIRAIQHIEVRALEGGYLQDVFVDEGKPVKEGERMFQIMPVLYRAELRKSAAEAEFAKIEYQNTKILRAGNVVSPNELAMAKAQFDKAKAALSLTQAHLNLTEIKAPFDGIMGRLRVRRGSLLDEGDLLTTLSDNSQMWVYFNVTEAEYLDYKSHLGEGDPMSVSLIMANNEAFDQPGKVETIEADFNPETGNIAFRATFPNPLGLLRHGETGKVVVSTSLENALLIPQKATFDILDKKFVYVVGEGDAIVSRQISVAEELPHLYVVADGLTENDKILLEGLRKVHDGDVISPRYESLAEVMPKLDVPAG